MNRPIEGLDTHGIVATNIDNLSKALVVCGVTRLDGAARQLARKLLEQCERDRPPGVFRRMWRCDVCGHADFWTPEWSWYGSVADWESGGRQGIFVVCSEECVVRCPKDGKGRPVPQERRAPPQREELACDRPPA